MDDAERADFWKIEAFGDHLGTDDNVVIASANLLVDFIELLAGFGVGVKAGDFSVWKKFFEFFFDEFSAETFVMNSGIAAFRAGSWYREDAAAGMAAHLVLIGMKNKW